MKLKKHHSDSWVDKKGSKRAFIGKVRAENGVDYETSLFIAEIPDDVDITTAYAGDKDTYPVPPKGVKIRRLTHSTSDDGIVRGSYDGTKIAYLSKDKNGIKQIFIIAANGSDVSKDPEKHPKQVTSFKSDASNIRWHPSDKRIFSISNGKIYESNVESAENFGKTILLTPDTMERGNLVVSPDGKMLAYNVAIPAKDDSIMIDGKVKDTFDQIFVLELKN